MKLPRLSPGWIVTLGFGCLFAIAFGVIYLIPHFIKHFDTYEEACYKKCSALGRFSRMVPEFPPEQTAGMRAKGPTRCECY